MKEYTGFVLDAELKNIDECISILQEMNKDRDKRNITLTPDHPFFKHAGFESFFWYISEQHVCRWPKMIFIRSKNLYRLSIAISVNNYDEQIEDFLSWIAPYVVRGAGYIWKDQDSLPLSFMFKDGFVYMQ